MFTQESLKRGYFLQTQEQKIIDRLELIETRLTSTSQVISDMPHGTGSGDTVARLVCEYVDLENELRTIKEEHKRVDKETASDIEYLDEYHKTLLTERYIELKSWVEMGNERQQSADTIRVYVSRFVKKSSGK